MVPEFFIFMQWLGLNVLVTVTYASRSILSPFLEFWPPVREFLLPTLQCKPDLVNPVDYGGWVIVAECLDLRKYGLV